MTKERILSVFKDINQMYNNARMYDGLSKMLDELVEDIKKSVEPERKPGKWIENKWGEETCSECGYIHKAEGTNYCPNCGAKMEV